MKLYAVVVLSRTPDRNYTVAICTSLEEARDIVEHKPSYIHETIYNSCVIESLYSDKVDGYGREQYWYTWIGSPMDGKYVECERASSRESIIGYWQ